MLEHLYTPKAIVALMAVILAVNGLLLYQFGIIPLIIQSADTPSSSESPQAPNPPPQDEDEEAEEEEAIEEEAAENDGDEENGGAEDEAPVEEEAAIEDDEAPSDDEAPVDDGEAEDEAPLGGESPAGDDPDGREEVVQAIQSVEGSGQEGQPSVAGPPPEEAQSGPPDTPFGSQYDPPPTNPGDGAGGGSELGASGDFDPGVSSSGGQPEGGLARIQTVVLSALYEIGDDDPEGSGPEGSGPEGSGPEGSGSEVGDLPATSGLGVFPILLVVAAVAGAAFVVFRRR